MNDSRCCATTSEKNVYFVMSKREKYVKAEIFTNIQCISTANKVLIIQDMKKHGWSEIRHTRIFSVGFISLLHSQ
jgi:hypothetical protein